MNNNDKVSELIFKLSISGLPPSFQEYVINGISELSDEKVLEFIEALDGLGKTEVKYLKAADKYKDFLNSASIELRKELKIETDKIKKELMEELVKNEKGDN